METNIGKKHIKNYFCEYCDFSCDLKSDYDRHLVRPKHQKNVEINKKSTILDNFIEKNILSKFVCEKCTKEYKERSGLWKHKKKGCSIKQPEYRPNANLKSFIIEIIKTNPDLQKEVTEYFSKIPETK
jgi:ribosomal protein L37AE/L43A